VEKKLKKYLSWKDIIVCERGSVVVLRGEEGKEEESLSSGAYVLIV
jgi:hypothetical protein